MDDVPLFDAPWPDDLDPATVSLRKRSVTILRRTGYSDDQSSLIAQFRPRGSN